MLAKMAVVFGECSSLGVIQSSLLPAQKNRTSSYVLPAKFSLGYRPNCLVKPTPTSSACWYPPCFALRCGLPRALAPLKTNLFRPCLFKRHSISQALFSAWFAVSPGFAWWRYAGLWSFWPLALVQQAQAAIILVVLRSLGGAALFRSSCPSPNPSYRF